MAAPLSGGFISISVASLKPSSEAISAKICRMLGTDEVVEASVRYEAIYEVLPIRNRAVRDCIQLISRQRIVVEAAGEII